MTLNSFVVIGLGRFGSAVATELYRMGHEVLGIDNDETRVRHISDKITHAVTGDPMDEEVLHSMGVRNFDCAIVSSAEEMQNSVLLTMMLKEIGVKYVVAKAQSNLHRKVLERVGADKVLFPERDSGYRLAHNLSYGNLIELSDLTDEYGVAEFMTPEKWVGKSLKELDVRTEFGLNIIAIRCCKGKVEVSPKANRIFQEGELIVAIGDPASLKRRKGL